MTKTDPTDNQEERAMPLSENLRDELKSALFDIRCDSFRDCMYDYIRGGVNIIGLDQMADEDLIVEYTDYLGEEEDDLIKRCIAEMEMDNLLKA